jgi:hypothetical protein
MSQKREKARRVNEVYERDGEKAPVKGECACLTQG